ncbi:MAG: histidinol dehydrogenase, partial [Myxococcales bacterium]|nr:histidinol dehydrogenase [Myxococcales bacterium]
GGAQAIAALAYGTGTIAKVDKIVGPGNIYVATAKRQLFGVVDIDMIAGPSEVTVIADSTTDPRHLAADLLAQAEHDERAIAGVLCHDPALADPLARELERQLETLPRRAIAERSLRTFGYFAITASVDASIALANRIAPEHLELALSDAARYVDAVRFAGCVFVGGYSPEALGDYCAGPNHVLPTGGSARFFSPLGVYDFITRVNVVELDRAMFRELAPHVVELARDEGLEAHARSVTIRLEE